MIGLRGKKKTRHTVSTAVFWQQGEVRAVFCWLDIVFFCLFVLFCFLKLCSNRRPQPGDGKGASYSDLLAPTAFDANVSSSELSPHGLPPPPL